MRMSIRWRWYEALSKWRVDVGYFGIIPWVEFHAYIDNLDDANAVLEDIGGRYPQLRKAQA